MCSALSEGGLTPTLGLARLAKATSPVPVFAMIRIRGGNFVYTEQEISKILQIKNLFVRLSLSLLLLLLLLLNIFNAPQSIKAKPLAN